jgi:phosphotransferase system  glucose/maltose/N-acetylglucosamine-specific IIC component
LSAAAGRSFGLTLGIAFGVLTAILWWRERETVATITAVLSVLLIFAGLVAPTKLGPIERGWMAFARAISKITTPIFMGIVYYVAIAPIGMAMRVLGRNPIARIESEGGFWLERRQGADGRSDLRRQF